jgi:uncharacterized protein
MALQYRVLDHLRHTRAFEVAGEPATEKDFAALRDARQCLVITVKRSGEPVPTPVNFGLADDGRLYFRSEPHVAKIRRLRRDPRVRVCPCNLRGNPIGPIAEGTARLLTAEESEHAHAVVAANWDAASRLLEPLYDRIGVATVYVEVVPGSE